MKKYFYLALCVAFVGCKSNTSTESITSESQVDSVSLFVAQIDSISELIEVDSLNASFYFDRAGLYMKTQSLGPGISDLQYAVQLDSTNAEYWGKLGVLNYAMQQTRNAKDCWERCSNLDTRNLDCRLNLAEMYLAVGELKKGQRRLNEILDLDPQNSSALFLTGNYALMEKDTVKAMKYIQSAINEDQSLFRAYDQMGVLYSSKGDLLALDYFNAALRLEPYRFDIHYKVGMFYQSLQAFDEAISAYQRVLSAYPDHKTSLHNIAVIAVFGGDLPRAIEYFTKAIGADASYLEAYFGRAYTYELLGNLIKSESDYRTSLMLDPAYLPSIDGLARVDALKLN
jgi:tetratricopeptide (TPR) repeat protein